MTIDPNHTTASAAANMATVGAAAHNTTTTRLVRPAVSSHLLSNLYTAPSFQIRTQWPSSSPAAANHQGVLYPLASSGRSFIHRLIRPTAAAGQPEMNPHSLWPTPELGIPRSSTPPEVAQSSVPDSNGFKDMMDKSKDDNLAIIRGRKVRMTDGASPYGWSYPPIDLRRQRRKDGTPTSHSPNLTNRKSSHQSELSILRAVVGLSLNAAGAVPANPLLPKILPALSLVLVLFMMQLQRPDILMPAIRTSCLQIKPNYPLMLPIHRLQMRSRFASCSSSLFRS
ncbi:hypothetical protein FF1_044046 [Malus domestica]